jgi:hypothetical protein
LSAALTTRAVCPSPCAQVAATYLVPLSERGMAAAGGACEATSLACAVRNVLPGEAPAAQTPSPAAATWAPPPATTAPAPAGVPVALVGASVAGAVVTGAVVVAALVAIRRKRRRLDEAGGTGDDKADELVASRLTTPAPSPPPRPAAPPGRRGSSGQRSSRGPRGPRPLVRRASGRFGSEHGACPITAGVPAQHHRCVRPPALARASLALCPRCLTR